MLEDLNVFFSNMNATDERIVAGIDEAGRGPIVGPMVYAIYTMPVGTKTPFKDSKVLSPKMRSKLFVGMRGYAYVAVDPVYITSHMNGGTKNLNEISRVTVLRLLRELKNKCKNVDAVYIDALGDNARYKEYLKQHFDFKFVVENKADSKYEVVSGASIVAKVTRDAIVSLHGCGSGYPADPRTKSWLLRNRKEFSGFPSIVRHSWQPVKALLAKKRARAFAHKLDGFYIGPD